MLGEWQKSAQNIIAHYRCAFRGQNVFSRGLDQKIGDLGLDQTSIEYLLKINTLVAGMRMWPIIPKIFNDCRMQY